MPDDPVDIYARIVRLTDRAMRCDVGQADCRYLVDIDTLRILHGWLGPDCFDHDESGYRLWGITVVPQATVPAIRPVLRNDERPSSATPRMPFLMSVECKTRHGRIFYIDDPDIDPVWLEGLPK